MNDTPTSHKRLQKLDIIRGLALFGMVIYHFSWDLSYFSYIPSTVPAEGSLLILARIVAFSFLFVSGFSLYLAHGQTIRWRSFSKRLIMIVLSACLVSAVTYFVLPQGFIYFGILHEIALTSIVGLLFLRTPLVLNIIVIIAVCAANTFLQSDSFNTPLLLWVGLSTSPPLSFDYVPFFPWFAAGLAGITLARLMTITNIMHILRAGFRPHWLSQTLQWLGRHSLLFYLVHQPILLAILFVVSQFVPPSPQVLRLPMENACIAECAAQADKATCQTFCGCVFDRIEAQKLLGAFSRGEIEQTDERLQIPINMCWSKMTEHLNDQTTTP